LYSSPHSFYTCRDLHTLTYILSSSTNWPRMFYRRDVSSGVVLFVWCSVLVRWKVIDVLSWCLC
jgi:hypothetical protein